MATLHYRLRIRDKTDTSDLLVLSTVPGGTNPYITVPPRGDGQSIDPILGKSTIGRYTWRAWDKQQSATTYTITEKIADAQARNQLSSNRCVQEWSDDVGGNWYDLHTGFLNRHRLVSGGEWEFIIGDTDRREQQREIFKYVDREAGLFPKVSCIIGGPVPGGFGFGAGLKLDYGPVRFKVIADPSTIITDNRVTLQLVSGYLRPWYIQPLTIFDKREKETINHLAKTWFEYDPTSFATNPPEKSQPWGWFPGLVVEMQPVAGGATIFANPIAKEAQKRSELAPPISPEGPVGEHDALVNGSTPRLIVRWDDVVFGTGMTPAQPAIGTEFDVLVYAREISKDSPLQISGHPLEILTTLLFENGIPFDAASVAATRANPSVGDELRVELVVEGPAKLGKWLTDHILGPFGIGMRIKDDGEREIFPTRGSNPASVATITLDDVVTPDGGPPDDVIFDVDEKTTINGVDYRMRTFRRFRNPTSQDFHGVELQVDGDDPNSQTINLLTYGSFTIEGRRSATNVQGERVHTFDIPGQILFFNSGLNAYTGSNQTKYAQDAGDVIIDRTGWGVIAGAVRVRPSTPGLPGDFVDLQVPHQVNANTSQTPKAQRGGTRKVQIVKRTNEPSASALELWDAGNLAQTVAPSDGTNTDPTPVGIVEPAFTLAPQSVPPVTGGVPDPLHIATVTVSNGAELAAAGADVHFEYLVQTATPSASDSGLAMGVLAQPDVVSTIDTPSIDPSGQRVWVRAQTRVPTTGQLSAWSAWQSIDLGPEQTGTQVPQPTLSFTVDGAGLVDVAASVAANVTEVKIEAASVGAAEASDAAVRAATADTVAPFEALDIFTLAPGEQRAVSAFAYDQFGNESQKATIVVERPAANSDAEFIVAAAHASLTAERVATDTPTIDWDFGTASQAKAHVLGTFQTLTDGATVSWDVTNKPADIATVTLGGNRALAITGAVAGSCGILIVKQDGTGSRTLTLPGGSNVRDAGAGAIVLSTAINAVDVLGWVYDGTNYWWAYNTNFS